jgi:hydrogenase-4 component B
VEDDVMSESLAVIGIVACAISGVPGLFFRRSASLGQWISSAILVGGCAIGLSSIGAFWWTGEQAEIRWLWPVPGGEFRVEMDGFRFCSWHRFLIAGLGSVYGLGYWTQANHPENGRRLSLFYGLLPAGMALLVLSRNSLLFLAGWEIMAIANFFLVTTVDHDKEVRRVGWIYLVATHLTTLCLFALFALLAAATGSFDLRPLRAAEISPPMALAVFILCVLGFGMKAGIMPLHVWLPGAHAMAPTHVSAMMSGVVIKMGIYGMVRIISFLPNPPVAWGAILLALGAISGILGVAYAIGQHDVKRLLAYHSIENIGIIVMGIGLALIGRAVGRVDWIYCGMTGALLHVWNHALFKALLFLGAGSVIHATGTREIDHLGGLAKAMPYTAFCFLAGAVAICGLPPLNGFVSEFLIYLGLFRALGIDGGPSMVMAALAAPALASSELAIACFVKVFGAIFLGTPRSSQAVEAHESGWSMVGPMLVLVAGCFAIGLAPILVSNVLKISVQAWAVEMNGTGTDLSVMAPWGWITAIGWILLVGIALAHLFLRIRMPREAIEPGPTWGCGYSAPTARMQYTSSSFAQMLVGLFAWALRPKRRRTGNLSLFPRTASFHSEVGDAVLDEGVLPAFRFVAGVFGWFRILQQGSIQLYLLYIFLALLALFFWR